MVGIRKLGEPLERMLPGDLVDEAVIEGVVAAQREVLGDGSFGDRLSLVRQWSPSERRISSIPISWIEPARIEGDWLRDAARRRSAAPGMDCGCRGGSGTRFIRCGD
jgi:hypothetical protein